MIVSAKASEDIDEVTVDQIKQYLQKPSLDDMHASEAIFLSSSLSNSETSGSKVSVEYALIDTGVVVFTGVAMQVRLHLLI